jgi:hypothetical protein
MNIRQSLSAAVVAVMCASTIPLVNADERTGYAGVGVGRSSLDESGFDDDTGYKIFGGYQFNKHVAFEGAYIDLGDFTSSSSTVSVDGFQATALGMVPIGQKFRVFGKAGLFHNGGTDLTYGLGFEWGNKIGVRVEWERFTDVSGSADADMLSASAVFSFGSGRSR